MAESFKLRIVTPTGLAVDEAALSVTAPGLEGEVGFLPQHVQYTGVLGAGILTYVSAEGGATKRLVVSGGFAQFFEGELLILADVVDTPESVDRTNYAKDRAELQRMIEQEDTSSASWTVARESLNRIEAIDQLLAH